MSSTLALSMAPVDMPSELHIGIKNAYKAGKHYVYRWEPTLRIFICDEGPLVILTEGDATALWYVAVEGSLTRDAFVASRAAWRTQEKFWIVGWRNWQINCNSVSGKPDWDLQDQLKAETRVPLAALSVAVGLQQLAITG